MFLRRTMIAVLLSLTFAFLQTAASAIAHPCIAMGMSSDDGLADGSGVARIPMKCPCEGTMPGCAGMARCQVGPECATQCLGCVGVLATTIPSFRLLHLQFVLGGNERFASLSLAPPAPPPRA